MSSYLDYLTSNDDEQYRLQVRESVRQDNQIGVCQPPSWLNQQFARLMNVLRHAVTLPDQHPVAISNYERTAN
jgi:hypothetical protein